MALQMRTGCERCDATLELDGEAYICSYECTFCPLCAGDLMMVCPNCGGELLRRPRRVSVAGSLDGAHTPAEVSTAQDSA